MIFENLELHNTVETRAASGVGMHLCRIPKTALSICTALASYRHSTPQSQYGTITALRQATIRPATISLDYGRTEMGLNLSRRMAAHL